MGFEQNFRKKKFNSIKSPIRPANSELHQVPKLTMWTVKLSSIWMNASNEEEVSESFSFAFYF